MEKHSGLNRIINESIRKVLKEEYEKNVDDKVIDLISCLHNAQKPLREIHWNTRSNALHLVSDETMDDFYEWEDTLGESFIKDRNIKMSINDTKPSDNSDFVGIVKYVLDLASEVKSLISDKKDYDSINAVIDEIIEGCGKMAYRGQFK